LIINIRKGKEKRRKEGPTDQKRSLPNPGTNALIPQGNVRVRDRDINTPAPPAHSRWLTLRRFQREKSPDGSAI
jgi:hypothetical protein